MLYLFSIKLERKDLKSYSSTKVDLLDTYLIYENGNLVRM